MTRERVVELLEIEHECMLRGSYDECDRNCLKCELVQKNTDLDEMYKIVIDLLKNYETKIKTQQSIEGIQFVCETCGTTLWTQKDTATMTGNIAMHRFCHFCGRKISH